MPVTNERKSNDKAGKDVQRKGGELKKSARKSSIPKADKGAKTTRKDEVDLGRTERRSR